MKPLLAKALHNIGYIYAIASLFIGPVILNIAESVGTPAYLDCSDSSFDGVSNVQRDMLIGQSTQFVATSAQIMLIASLMVCLLTLYINRKRLRRAINPILAVTIVSLGYVLMYLTTHGFSCNY